MRTKLYIVKLNMQYKFPAIRCSDFIKTKKGWTATVYNSETDESGVVFIVGDKTMLTWEN